MFLSLPVIIWPNEDIYDVFLQDNLSTSTQNFFSDDNFSQLHNFRVSRDVDWALFNADPYKSYDIMVTGQAPHCDAALYLYHESDIENPLVIRDDWHQPINEDEILSWDSNATSGTMYVKVTQSPFSPEWSGEETTYTLKVFSTWGPSTGLATITGTSVIIGPMGGIIQAGAGGQYTKPSLNIPAGALDRFVEFLLEDPGDIGNNPVFPCTIQWLDDHPKNASIVRIYSSEPVSFSIPATLTLQFIDDGPVFYGFQIDDIPSGKNPADMRVFSWDESAWTEIDDAQSVVSDTVTLQISDIDRDVFAAAPTDKTRIHDWMLY